MSAGSASPQSVTVPKVPRAQRAPAKYAELTVYDPARGVVVDGAGNTVTGLRDAVGGGASADAVLPVDAAQPIAVMDRLYACELADRATIVRLAALANTSISDLEYRRHGWTPPTARPSCVAVLPPDRRRCMWCLFYLQECDDDDLPF